MNSKPNDSETGSYQSELEIRALALLGHQKIREVRAQGEEALRQSVESPSAESVKQFELSSEEITFFAILNGLNQNRDRPEIHYVERLPYFNRGVAIPGSRGLDDNPDTVYRIIPVDHHSSYRVYGNAHTHPPIVNDFTILSEDWITMDNLDKSNLVVSEAGQFEISISPEPAGGRPNHIRTAPNAKFVLIRDTLADWQMQRPNKIAVERLGPPGTKQPLTEEELLKSVERHIKRWYHETIRLHALGWKHPANHLPQPEIRTDYGMLVSQAYSVGHFAVAETEALVITVRPGGAKYLTVPVTNIWGVSTDPVNRTTSLNSLQAAQSRDGRFILVLSSKDPGVANWLDSDGLDQGFLFLRWAAFDVADTRMGSPSVECKLVPFAALREHLPPDVGQVDQTFRRQQLLSRSQAYGRRFEG